MRSDFGAQGPADGIMGAVWYGRLYDETVQLVTEARAYAVHGAGNDRRGMAPVERIRASCEALRVTTRLAEVMAWLLIRRAVHAGEITAEEAAQPEHRLARAMVCFDTKAGEDAAMPTALRDLLRRSFALYTRVARLDDHVALGVKPLGKGHPRPTIH